MTNIYYRDMKKLIDAADEVYKDSLIRDQSKPLYEEALKKVRRARAELDGEYIKGKLDLVDENWENALIHFNKILLIKPKDHKALCYSAIAYEYMDNKKEAKERIKMSIDINPNYSIAWVIKSYIIYNELNFQEAFEAINRAIGIDPVYFTAWYRKGVILKKLNRVVEALNAFKKATDIKPNYSKAWNNIGLVYSKMGENNEALKAIDRAISIDNYHKYWDNKGFILMKMNRNEEALKAINEALEIDSKYESALTHKHYILIRLGEQKKAYKEMRKLFLEKTNEVARSDLPQKEKNEKILRINIQKEIRKELKYDKIWTKKVKYEERLKTYLMPTNKPLGKNFFLVLRRWNSYTPRMLTETESNLGGGYFLYWKGKGFVIDPGFDFLNNYFNYGLRLENIDAVIITHAHVDHCSDFEALLMLIYECNKQYNKEKKIDVFMNIGAMKKYLSWMPIDKYVEKSTVNRIYPLSKGISYKLEEYNLAIKSTEAIHNEVISKEYSVGIIFDLFIDITNTEETPFRIGLTSDTKSVERIISQYENVDIIVPHLGSIELKDFEPSKEKENSGHLMLTGVISTIDKSNAKLAIISEFGEELGKERMAIVNVLDKVFRQKGIERVFTGDIGLDIKIPNLTVKNDGSGRYVSAKSIIEVIPKRDKQKSIKYITNKYKTDPRYI